MFIARRVPHCGVSARRFSARVPDSEGDEQSGGSLIRSSDDVDTLTTDEDDFGGLHHSRLQTGSSTADKSYELSGEAVEQFDEKLNAILERGKRHKIYWTEALENLENMPPTGHTYAALKERETSVDSLAGILRNFKPVASKEKAAPAAKCQYSRELAATHEDKRIVFPIDNQSLLWEESAVPFTEHISLAKYITFFPPETHQFMETIISALQNNPDYTVGRKRAIIWGYLNYFQFHKKLLRADTEEVIKV